MDTIKPGDKVVWFASSNRGRVTSFRKGHGLVKRIEGDTAIVDTGCSRVRKPLAALTLQANDTPLSIITHATATVTV